MPNKLLNYIKLGFGVYFGYTLAKNLDSVLGEIYLTLKRNREKTKENK